ncbi:fasciclin domain-containing protein [Streptomyces tsukubensis]|uniref:Fasciclin n=1 Tax=Streptomyces tsukubensis TaxID=83656 RepID=A0A1V4AF35_9ACTN|nr:fasciclin domain-containing protein [Streptomyces tsukubensis]OON82246.1 fasciclin [Streptomyces tsukubensis]QFR92737.1 fasciclin domain-containing protein [Streptomyces tsukubensis]
MNTTPRLRIRRATLAVTAAALLPLSLAACSSDSDNSASDSSSSAAKKPSPEKSSDSSMTMDKPFGSACSTVPKSGAGSFNGMAKDPVATAASNNPDLSTLVTAVKKAGLVDTLNSAKNITVFAPTNEAFAKIPKADLDNVLSDKAQLTKILTYHVVGEKVMPKQLAKGSFDTLEKSKLTTSGSGTSYKVNDSAKIVCGNVPTANATVHIIDTVLMPKS